MATLTSLEKIEIINFKYTLGGTLRCHQWHFICAFKTDDDWFYVDDLCNSGESFSHVIDIFSKTHGLFFGIYIDNTNSSAINHYLDTLNLSGLKSNTL